MWERMGRAFAVAAFLCAVASHAHGQFQMVSGRLQASAHAELPTFEDHDTPPDLVLGSAFGAFSLNANAAASGVVADITAHTQRTPTSLIQGFDGQASSTVLGGVGFAWTTGSVLDVFTIADAQIVQIRSEATSFQAQMGVRLSDAANNTIYERQQVVTPIIDVLNLPAGTYSLSTGGGHINGNTFNPPASAMVTLTIIPEPAAAGVVGAAACLLAIVRRR